MISTPAFFDIHKTHTDFKLDKKHGMEVDPLWCEKWTSGIIKSRTSKNQLNDIKFQNGK